jgi:serine/threonine protein kinase
MVEPQADPPTQLPPTVVLPPTAEEELLTLTNGPQPSRPASRTELNFLAPPEQPDELGRLGNYRILRRLGQGGMGCVFAAEDLTLLRPIALKVMLPSVAANPDARARFLREGRTAAAVRSDHVVTIYHVGEANGVPFLSMELLRGQTLDQWLRTQTTPPTEAILLRVAHDVLTGLVAAHSLGLIHRDLKPANLWIEADPRRIKLLDFGLTCPMSAPHLTHAGTVVGTPAYMPLEQANCQPMDGRSDLYSLGAVLHRMAAGRAVFERGSTLATLLALAVDEPPPLPHLAPEVAGFIARLMGRHPDQRPASAVAALHELNALIAAPSGATLSPLMSSGTIAKGVWSNLESDTVPATERTAVPEPPAPEDRTHWPWLTVSFAAVLLTVGTLMWRSSTTLPAAVVTAPIPATPVALPIPVLKAAVAAPRTRWLEFTGQTQVELPGLALANDGPLTVEAWVWRSAHTEPATLIELRGPRRLVKLYAHPGHGQWVADGLGANSTGLAYRAAPLTPIGEWCHLALTWKGHESHLFINGVPQTEAPKGYPPPTYAANGAWLGRAFNDHGPELRHWFVGRLGGVRVSSKLRYTVDFIPPAEFSVDDATVALYPCDDGAGTTLRDLVQPQRPGRISLAQWGAQAAPIVSAPRQLLLPPRSTAGWVAKTPGDVLLTDQGVAIGGQYAGLFTTTAFGNFDLACEVKLSPGTTAGLALRADNTAPGTQPLLRLHLVNAGTKAVPSEQAGALFGIVGPTEPPALATGTWHWVRVRLVGSRLQAWVNGEATIALDLQDEQHGRLPAVQQAYRALGRLGLLAHGPKAEFRNVCVANVTALRP